MLGVLGRDLVGLTAENVTCRLIYRAPLQRGLPQDDNLYLVIGGHDAEEDGDGSGWRWSTAAATVAAMVVNHGGGGINNPNL
jgi:hypothetical protein